MIVHHSGSLREWSYDCNSGISHLEKGLDDAAKYNWLIVGMKNDRKKFIRLTEIPPGEQTAAGKK